MTKEEKYAHWEALAIYDLETADAMLKSGRYMYVAFTCQQAIEKLAKALHVLYLEKEAPKTHNIITVITAVFDVYKPNTEDFEEKYKKYQPLMAKLFSYYVSERYVEYKNKINKTLDKRSSEKLLEETKEVFVWLQSLKNF